MSKGKGKLVMGTIVLTDEQRHVLAESVDEAWKAQLDVLHSTINNPEGYDEASVEEMKKRLGTLHQIQKGLLK